MQQRPVLGQLGLMFGVLGLILMMFGVGRAAGPQYSVDFFLFMALLAWGIGMLFVVGEGMQNRGPPVEPDEPAPLQPT
jgi:hypothetical protein